MAEQRTGLRDDEALVEAIVRGAQSYAQIAREQGVSRACVSQIARGVRRPELHERIVEAQEAMLMQARRLGVACAVQAMAVHIREGIEGKGETARKCREYLINRALGPPGKPAAAAPSAKRREQWPSLLALPEDLFDPTPMMTTPGRDDPPEPESEGWLTEADETPQSELPDEEGEPAPAPEAAPAEESETVPTPSEAAPAEEWEAAPLPQADRTDQWQRADNGDEAAGADAPARSGRGGQGRRGTRSRPRDVAAPYEPTDPAPEPYVLPEPVLVNGIRRPG